MEFNEEDLTTIQKLAGCNYSTRQIATYLGIAVNLLFTEYQDTESPFYIAFQRGRLMAQADINMKLLDDAKGGNLTASAQYNKAYKANQLALLKDELFGIR